MARPGQDGKEGESSLPTSLAAQGPATSLPGSETSGSRPGSLTWRRRSLNRDGRQASTSDAAGTADKDRRGRGRETTLQEELKMPDKRVCFPHWPSYLSLMIFIAFWAGFFAIGIVAFMKGQPDRLTHATDMFGFTCGEVNDWNGIQVDLRGKNKLHWLDPFELTNPRNRWFAKAICVSQCPAAKDVCTPESVPCLSGNQYRCPYYSLAQDGLYDTLPYEETWGTQYFDALSSTSQSECWATQQAIPEMFDQQEGTFMHNDSTGAKRCGEFYQLTSQYPGSGPCYANWAYSTVYLNKCVPVFPAEVEAALTGFKQTHPNDTRTYDPLVQPLSGWDVGDYLLDVIHGWEIMTVMGLAVPLALSIMVMLLMQKHPTTIIWLGLIACVLTLIADTLLAFAKAGEIGNLAVGGEFKGDIPEGANTTGRARKLWVVTGAVIGAAALAVLITAILLCRHIKFVVSLLKVVSKVVSDNSLVLLIPIVPTLIYMGIALFWVWSAVYQFTQPQAEPVYRSSLNGVTTWWNPNSTLPIRAYELLNLTAHPSTSAVLSGHPLSAQHFADPTMACAYDPDCYLALSFSSMMQRFFTYNYFGFWLANEFITTVTGVCIIFFLSHHYFVLADGKRPPPLGWWRSIGCTWLALPPLMVGTFTNAVVDWCVVLRPICATIDKAWRRKVEKDRGKAPGKCMTWVWAPCRGLAFVSNRLMRYSDRRGYFCGALHNKTYWQGCRIAHSLAEDSGPELESAFDQAGTAFLMCKLGVVGLSTLGALGWSMASMYSNALRFPDTYLSNGLLPILSCILSSYFITELWASVYEASLNVLLLAYCEDCKMHGGQPTVSNRELVQCFQEAAKRTASRRRRASGNDLAVRMFNPAYDITDVDASAAIETLDPRSQGLEAIDRKKTGMSL